MNIFCRVAPRPARDESNTAVLFVCPRAASVLDFEPGGAMPIGQRFGFIFTGTAGAPTGANGRTAGHELGHGVFSLRHPDLDKDSVGFPAYRNDVLNLMCSWQDTRVDAKNVRLRKPQWDQIQHGARIQEFTGK